MSSLLLTVFGMYAYSSRRAATLGTALAVSFALSLFAVLSPLTLHLQPQPAYAATCTNSYGSGASAPVGYAVAWNPLTAARELLVQGIDCTTRTATMKVGSGAVTQYVYKKGYYYTGTAWREYTLTGTSALYSNAWYTGSAVATVQLPRTVTYVVGYVCQYLNSTWKCGCRDAGCSTAYWQLQAVANRPTTGGGGSGSGYGNGGGSSATGELEAPPSMTQNPLTITGKCLGESGATTNDMAGRDVKIILPTNRVCTRGGNLGGTSGNPAHNIWLVGGKIDVKGQNGGAALSIINWTGTAYIEGIEIDVNNAESDGIRTVKSWVQGENRRVVVQNSYIRGMGYGNIAHGDFFHAQDQAKSDVYPVKELVLRNVRADLENQGLFVPYRSSNKHGVARLVMDHVELRLDERYKYSGNKISTMIFAGSSGQNGDSPPPNGQVYNEVYLNWWDPWYPNTTGRTDITNPKPSSYDSKGCAVFSSGTISANKITGTWCKGSPAGGTFVPLDKIGLNYDRASFAGN